ncbi:hypothetical protein FSP39_018681 [Pinctada imbricata]|uniref:VWFA domain-containing protein n=1 Tax=Pinctada imbricata TaxID=66713 RepID=A0AA88Y352_PINIB|nr:hypothetical protein FSP39_018681 [Pinctada imbricata]
MKSNLNNDPTLLWQYFGSDQGVLTNYPASNLSNCQTLDARFRNYYVATASPVPKDVVIMFEASSAMTQKSFENSDPSTPDKPLIQLAKESSTTVLNTLGSLDRVGVIAFNGDVTTPLSQDGCYRQTLAKATRNNINKLKGFINNKGVNGDSDYNKAFAAAFQFFNESERSLQGEKRDRIILFLTSGSSYSGNPLEIIRDGNAAMNNEVVIHVFQLGKDRPQETEELLRNISRQVLNPGSTRTGRYMVLSDQKMLMTAMGEYYQYSENERQEDPVFSEPFIDMFSQKGLLISMCLPVYTVGGFKGVVCNDFRLEELLADVTYLREGENSYAFVIDGFGRTLVHPLLPQRRQSTDNPDIVDIENFERLVGQDVIQSMKRGETGNKTGIVTKMPISRGIMLYEGDTSKTIKANYFWTKVQKSNYSVCVVIKEDLSSLKELKDATIDSKGFYYHTREITDYGSQPCRHYARWATKDHSCVMLAPSSFADPTGYLIRNETQAKIREYERYLRGDSTNNPGFVDTLLNSVAATYKLESFWKDSISHDQAKYVVWRYICTKDGITRLYPCVQLTKDYDPALRPWYQRTIAKRKKFVLSTPYLDAWGSGYLLTLSRSMYEGKLNGQHSPDDVVVGVMGTDLTVNYFNQLIQEIYPICGQTQSYSCIVIDDSGFIVMHPDFVVTGSDPGLDNLFHIGNKDYKKSPSVNKCGSDNCDCLCYRDVDFNVCTNKYVQT